MNLFGIQNDKELFDLLEQQFREIATGVGLSHTLARQRVSDIYHAWRQDMKRANDFNFGDEEDVESDHVKCAAHLTYWIRRYSPVVDLQTSLQAAINPPYSDGQVLSMYSLEGMQFAEDEAIGTKSEEQPADALVIGHRKRIFAYANEYLAFDLGFRLARSYEAKKLGVRDNEFGPDVEFIDTICYIFKFKNISPHAIFLIYKSLLFDRLRQQKAESGS